MLMAPQQKRNHHKIDERDINFIVQNKKNGKQFKKIRKLKEKLTQNSSAPKAANYRKILVRDRTEESPE